MIVFTKQVIFTDCDKKVIRIYKNGDTVQATHKTETYYITNMGGIYFDEAKELSPAP